MIDTQGARLKQHIHHAADGAGLEGHDQHAQDQGKFGVLHDKYSSRKKGVFPPDPAYSGTSLLGFFNFRINPMPYQIMCNQ
jgi:hypothetical protein